MKKNTTGTLALIIHEHTTTCAASLRDYLDNVTQLSNIRHMRILSLFVVL